MRKPLKLEITELLMKTLIIVFAVLCLFVVVPLWFIWSLNTLFSLGIPYTVDTYIAAFLLVGPFLGNSVKWS